MSNIDDKLFDLTSEELKNQDINWINKRMDSIEKYRINKYPYKDRTIFLSQNNNKNKQKNDINYNNHNNKKIYILIIIILSICLIVILVLYFLEINCINTCIKKIKSKY